MGGEVHQRRPAGRGKSGRPAHILAVVEEPAIGPGNALFEPDGGLPAEPAQLVGAHQLARRAVGLAQVMDDAAAKPTALQTISVSSRIVTSLPEPTLTWPASE